MREPQPRARLWGRQIRAKREAACLTQQRLADEVSLLGESLDQSTVSYWERGLTEPSLRYRRLIAQVLECDIEAIFPAIPKGWAA